MTVLTPACSARRHDLDWIRVCAFLLLILYHVGMFYVPWDWHVNSPRPVAWLEPVLYLTNPWRLTLLFLVSGAATRFLLDGLQRRNPGVAGTKGIARRLAVSRLARLGPPLLLGVFVVVPPQAYYEVFEAARGLGVSHPAGSPWLSDFWVKYATGRGGWCDADGCLITPTWNHLWFVAYLLLYSLGLAALLAAAGTAWSRIEIAVERGLRGWGLIVWPVLWLATLRILVAPAFPVTHALVDDLYNHALSFSAFLFGVLTARSADVRAGLERFRLLGLTVGLVAWGAWAAYAWSLREGGATPPVLETAMRLVYAVDQWAWIVACLGYGSRYLDRGGPLLRYLTGGVFCFYIVHQTLIVVAAHHLARLGLPLAVEALLLIAITFAGCLLAYEAARRFGPLGRVLGVVRRARGAVGG